MITPDYIPHKNLETDVKDFLESRNYLIYEATYHAIATTEIRDILRTRFTPTSLYLRGRADRIAIHKTLTLEFEFECKTHISRDYHDCTIELLPLIHHLSKSKLGVKCFYAYRDNTFSPAIECGFWIDQLPKIREIWIPPRRTNNIPWFDELARFWLPDIPVSHNAVGGSGDPFLIIDESIVKSLPHWQLLDIS